jgi:hypothetical protein
MKKGRMSKIKVISISEREKVGSNSVKKWRMSKEKKAFQRGKKSARPRQLGQKRANEQNRLSAFQ